jgi:FHA domain
MPTMGAVKHLSSGNVVILGGHNVAGRVSSSGVRLKDVLASNDHASIMWKEGRWEVRDLGSTNGTFVGDARVWPREPTPFAVGVILRFGCDAERWEVIDDHGPVAMAFHQGSVEARAAEDGLLALPDPDDVQISVVEDVAGMWFVELLDGSRRPVNDGERLTVAGQTWELRVPPAAMPSVGTQEDRQERPPATPLNNIALRFHVSLDQEHVRLEALDGAKVIQLGERSSFYMLLVLARHRMEEAEAGVPEPDQGWYHVVDLATALGVDERSLNVTVFRARQAVARAGVEGAEGIVERRLREVRIGTRNLQEIKS